MKSQHKNRKSNKIKQRASTNLCPHVLPSSKTAQISQTKTNFRKYELNIEAENELIQ